MDAKYLRTNYRNFLVPKFTYFYRYSFFREEIRKHRDDLKYAKSWIKSYKFKLGPVKQCQLDKWTFPKPNRYWPLAAGALKTCILKITGLYPKWIHREWR